MLLNGCDERAQDWKASMKGCRSLSEQEADLLMTSFSGPFAARNRTIFAIGRFTGERISAILQLKVSDVMQGNKVADAIAYRRANRKGKVEGRTVVLHLKAKEALAAWINQLARKNALNPDDYVFQSRKGQRPISRIQYHRILKNAIHPNGFGGKIATHSMRKTFADRVYLALGKDIFRTQKALGHKNINSTMQYLSFRESDIEAAILGM